MVKSTFERYLDMANYTTEQIESKKYYTDNVLWVDKEIAQKARDEALQEAVDELNSLKRKDIPGFLGCSVNIDHAIEIIRRKFG